MDRRWKAGLIAIVVGIAGLFASVSLWIVFEQDIFWQVRAGEELLRTHMFPWVDTWSYSARGQPWLNIQWLSTLLLYIGYATGASATDDVAGLIYLRGASVAVLFVALGAVVLASVRRAWRAVDPDMRRASPLWLFASTSAVVVVLLPCLYTALLPRLQLRSDLFVIITFAALVCVWQAIDLSSAVQRRCACAASVLGVLLAANLHAGTAPFVLLLAGAYSFAYAPARNWAWSGACLLAFFTTPYAWHVLPTLYEHLFYDRFNMLKNTDHAPLSWTYFLPRQSNWGYAGIAWLALCAAALLAVWRERRIWPLLGAAGIFTLLCISRERSIPYQAVFMLPFAARGLTRLPRVAVGAIVVCAWLGWHGSALSMAAMRGGGVHEGLYPVGCAKFLERAQPQGNVFHTFALGAYLVWYMRDRPLYVDTRETMYRPLQSEVIGSFQSPQITQALLRKYDAHTVVMPIPQTRFVPGAGFEDVIARFLPSDQWALVYFDKAAFVSVERIPEHAALIAEHEYTLLRPNLPANLYMATAGRDAERDATFGRELTRCLSDEPDNIYCTVAQTTLQRDAHAPTDARQHAVARLEQAVRLAERWNSPQWTHAMVELHRAYDDVGDIEGVRRIETRLPLWSASALQMSACAGPTQGVP